MNFKRVVITGLGALTPIGNTIPEYWNALQKGVSGAGPITRFNTEHFKTKFACEIKNFNPSDFIDRKELRLMDSCGQYAVVACEEAIQDSGLDMQNLNRDRVGVILGTGVGGYESIMEAVGTYLGNGEIPHLSPYLIPKVLGNMIAGSIAIRHDIKGVSYVVSSACASAAHAIADAYHYIKLGKAEVIISGGSEACILPTPVGGFNAMRALSTNNDSYKTASCPFDQSRDGFVMGEGAAVLILEEYEHAVARGAHIYAELAGVGLSTDTFHVTAPNPEGISAAAAMRNCIIDSNLKPEDVDYINAHATSTPQGDVSECKAITSVFGEHANNLLINSTKSMTGHLLGAAGAIEAVATILSVKTGKIPPTINLVNVDPALPSYNFCANHLVEKDIRVAISNSFGFGGHNASLLFTKYE